MVCCLKKFGVLPAAEGTAVLSASALDGISGSKGSALSAPAGLLLLSSNGSRSPLACPADGGLQLLQRLEALVSQCVKVLHLQQRMPLVALE